MAIDAGAVTDVDFSAGRALEELHQERAKAGVTLALIVAKVPRHAKFERMGLVDLIGSDRIYESQPGLFGGLHGNKYGIP